MVVLQSNCMIGVDYVMKLNNMRIKLVFYGMLVLLMGHISSCGESKDPGPALQDIPLEVTCIRLDLPMIAASQQWPDSATPEDYLAAYDQHFRPYAKPLYALTGVDLIDMQRARNGLSPLSPAQRDTAIAYKLGSLFKEPQFHTLLDTIAEVFPPDFPVKATLEPVMKRYSYYFPEVPLPETLFTHVNGYDPSGNMNSLDQVFGSQEMISLGLHYFLGPHYPFYSPNIPQYIRRRFDPAQMDIILAHTLAEGTLIPLDPQSQGSLISKLIQQGIYFEMVQRFVPMAHDSLVMHYTTAELMWAEKYEQQVFKEIAGQLFKQDMKLKQKLTQESPFTSGYAKDAAPRIGSYIGWQIVKSYLKKHPEVTLESLVQMSDLEKIYREAGYKP